jgi:hypothetical protein
MCSTELFNFEISEHVTRLHPKAAPVKDTALLINYLADCQLFSWLGGQALED